MKQRKRYIAFYRINYAHHLLPSLEEYGMMCTRSWWQCFKFGLRHIRQGKCHFFLIENHRPKKTSHSS